MKKLSKSSPKQKNTRSQKSFIQNTISRRETLRLKKIIQPFFTGLFLELRKKTVSLGKGLKILFALFALLLSTVVFYFEIYIPYDMTSSLFVAAVQTAYGVADLILIILFIFVLLLALSYQGGKMFYVWFFFS